MTKTDNELVFLPLGGVGEIGMNLALYGYGPAGRRKWVMVDCGVTFGDSSTPGVDLVLPDVRFVEEERKNLLGLVVTHAHEDHIGSIIDLWPRLKVPVYATPFTAGLLQAKIESEPHAPKIPIHVVPLKGTVTLDPFSIEYVSVAHSIPEANALAIRTPAGLVVHTGDWKIDPHPPLGQGTDEARMRELGEEGVLAVIGDSTNAVRSGRSPSESEVAANIADLIRSAPGRVAVTTFSSHIPRIRSVADVAAACGREVVVVGRAMDRTITVARELGYLDGVPPFRGPDVYGYLPPDRVVLVLTGSQGEPRAALARIAQDEHPEIALSKGDRLIFSSRTIPGNEKGVNAIINALTDRGVEVITDRTHLVHVSGHPRLGEMEDLYSWLKPRAVVPVHGEALHLAEHEKLARRMGINDIGRVRDGEMLRLAPGPIQVVDAVPVGRLYKDGHLLIPAAEPTVHERRRLSFAGIVSIAVAMTERGELAGEPDIELAGLPVRDDEGEAFVEIVREVVLDTIDTLPKPRRRDPDALSDVLKRAVRAEVNRAWGKKPLVHALVVIT